MALQLNVGSGNSCHECLPTLGELAQWEMVSEQGGLLLVWCVEDDDGSVRKLPILPRCQKCWF